ncbi:reverse transcriptase domain-containing protein [Tanacetum coccineum]
MDDEPMWAVDRVVALTLGSAITIPETVNEFAIKGNHLTLIKGNQFDGRTKTNPHKHIHEFLGICDMFKYRDAENEAVRLMIFTDKQSGRPSRSIPSNTQPNPKSSSSKPYQPPQARNERVNAVFTRSGKTYDAPVNLNDRPNDSETPINFDSDDEDDEPTLQPKTQTPKPVKETPIPKPYKPKIPYPQRIRKEKMEAQYGKFLDMIRVVRIIVPLVNVLAGMANYGKFLKELVTENMLVEVGKFTFPADFVILEMEEYSKVPLILGRSFLHTADAVIQVKDKQLNLGVRN